MHTGEIPRLPPSLRALSRHDFAGEIYGDCFHVVVFAATDEDAEKGARECMRRGEVCLAVCPWGDIIPADPKASEWIVVQYTNEIVLDHSGHPLPIPGDADGG